MTDDLVEFLRARLDEDERTARSSMELAKERWRPSEPYETTSGVLASENDRDVVTGPVGDWSETVVSDHEGFGSAPLVHAQHIARHDPARVLCEVEAKRRIVDEFERREAVLRMRTLVEPARSEATAKRDALVPVLRLLALPCADHPDYDESWQPGP